ncbi:MAG: hypothetical protein R2752_14185 [Vicinamibacterales bacterium]
MVALTALAVAGCGSSGGGGSVMTSTSPSTTSPNDRYVLIFDSVITSHTAIGSFTVDTKSTVHGQVALASTPTPNQFSQSSGDLTYSSFSYSAGPAPGCTFSTSAPNGSITVVEASVAPANANAVRVVLRPSSLTETIVQSCTTLTQTIPGIYWFSGWQLLHKSEGDPGANGWAIDNWTAGTGATVAVRTYSGGLTDAATGATYTEQTTIRIDKVN